MALLRLAVLALAACGQAGAQPSVASGLKPPAGWQALPELATSVGEATKTDGVMVDGVEAWGETARGCYAVWFAIHGSGASAETVLAGLATEKLATSNVVTPPSGDGLIAMTFARPHYTGRLRARTADGTITALACFANEREPLTCEAPCTTLLGAIP
ncbi:hypothetical protein BH11MYX3_BH11MYX3_08310 [soil metagenome]